MVDVEAVQLAVADDVDAGRLLRRDDDPCRVDQALLGRRRDEPLGDRVRPDDRRLDARRRPSFGHLDVLSRNSFV
jgi:hypothetical protein